MRRSQTLRLLCIAGLLAAFAGPVVAFTIKEVRHPLDELVFQRPELRVPQTPVDMADKRPGQATGSEGITGFRAEFGGAWKATLDERRDVVTLLHGGAIPFIPGAANRLRWEDFSPTCRDEGCLPVATIETLTRGFLGRHSALLGVEPTELALDPASVGPVEHMFYATYHQVVNGVPVEGAALRFYINRGNLLQVSTTRLAPVRISTTPALDVSTALSILSSYIGEFPAPGDHVLDSGTLRLIPITPPGMDPDHFEGAAGSGLVHALVYRIAFEREGVIGSWEALVDAHTGEILRFVDTNHYGRVHGGVYPSDGHTGATDRPFAYVKTNLPAPNDFADGAGLFSGNAVTVNLTQGKYTWVTDSCGTTDLTTANGDANYSGYPDPVSSDCAVPSPNPGGAGNTMSSRTQYYQVTAANAKARTFYPNNTWLNTNHMNVNVNQAPQCNAGSGGGTINFYKAASGCWNLGEIPGVSVHEWGHSWDDFDDSGGNSPPVETRADWTAGVQFHDSCTGRGFSFPSGNCSGYGDTCLNCSGIRDADYWQHQSKTPWTPANHGSVYSCSGGSYFGPCGLEDHCESGVATQALWDMVKGDRPAGEPDGDFFLQNGLDVPSGWQLMDRLYWGSHATLDSMYNCTLPTSSGCTGDTLYNTFMAIDDDGDGVANGTPHAAGIFAALNRHNIACGTSSEARNQNHTSSACLALTQPQNLQTTGQNNQVLLSWNAVANATRYEVLRNETSCTAGFTRVAEVTAPTTNYTDTGVANGIVYYYRIQPFYDNPPNCTGSYGPISACDSESPVPCIMPGTPISLSATAAGNNKISLTWANGAPAASKFNVYRAIGACPQAAPAKIATGVAATTFQDDPVSGQVPYAYFVTGLDSTSLCETVFSNCDDAQTTGACTQAPVFAGVASVSNPASGTCTLTLSWAAATAWCGGPLQYRIYRSTTAGFTPGPGNLIATVTTTNYTDINALVSGTTYYYIVHAEDSANSVEEANAVIRSGRPTGPPVLGSWVDDAGDAAIAGMVPASNCGGQIAWTTSTLKNHTGGGSRAYRSVLPGDANNPSGAVPDDNCSALVSPPLQTATGPQISFWTQYDLESNWDGVVVEARVCGDANCTTGTWQVLGNAELTPDYPATLSSSQTGDCSGAKVCGDVFPYPSGDGTEWINDCDYPSSMTAFTGLSTVWTQYTATLPASFNNATMQFRFNLTTDCATRNAGAYIDDLTVTNVMVPGVCATGSSCVANPQVDVTPNGPVAVCPNATQSLTAALSGGSGPFSYQWTRDGSPIPGAVSSTYLAHDSGSHTYNCKVRGTGCTADAFDPIPVTITWGSKPTFAGLSTVTNPAGSTCSLSLGWPAATSPCPGGVTYSVYRSTTSPVAVVAANRVASALTTTSYTDTEGIVTGTTYFYVVRAVAGANGEEDANTVEKSGSPSGASTVVFSDSFESGNLGWTFAKGSPAATTGDFIIGDPVATTDTHSRPSQPADDHTSAPGVNCLYTAANPAGAVGTDDVDNGEVRATSPVINLGSYATAQLSLWRWFENEDVDDSGDYYILEVSNNNGSTWTQIEQIPDSVTTTDAWTQVQVELTNFVTLTSTMRLRFRVADGTSVGDIVEFAADDIQVTGRQGCTVGAVGPPPVGDGSGVTAPLRLAKGTGNQLQVTLDNTHCQGHHAVILAGAIGNWSGYQWVPTGCALAAGAGTGTITDTHTNAWYIAVWSTNGNVAGSPGSGSERERTWKAAGFCSVTGDDPGDAVCN